MQSKNDEFLERLEKQNIEIMRVNSKLRESSCIQTQLNEELNEKTEQICQLHSENSKLQAELTRSASEAKNIRENEEHLMKLLSSERKNVDSKTKTLQKCEALLKMVIDKNEDYKMQNEAINFEVCIKFIFGNIIIDRVKRKNHSFIHFRLMI